MASLVHLLLCLAILVSPLIICTTSGADAKPRLYVFGGTSFDVGNGVWDQPNSQYRKYPYGISLPNKAYGVGRHSDGLIIPDFIASFANLGIIPPSKNVRADFQKGVNFASVSAGAIPNTFTIDLKKQVDNFMRVVEKSKGEIGAAETRQVLENSVYLLDFGGADYWRYFFVRPTSSTADKIALVNKVIAIISKNVFDIYLQGGRKFAFENSMPVGCVPAVKEAKNIGKNQCAEQLNEMCRLHNVALVEMANKLQMQLPRFNYTILDLYTPLHDRMINPQKYGFVEGDNQACCGRGARRGLNCAVNPFQLCPDRSKYVFFSGIMTTQAAELQLANLFWNDNTFASPYPLKHFFQDSPPAAITSTTPEDTDPVIRLYESAA